MSEADPHHRDAAATPLPLPDQVALVLQGGGALGSYQAGVYEALDRAGISVDHVAGISIGAVNAAIIAGNPPARRVERLRAFWDEMEREAADLAAPGFAPDRACIRPLWWEERPGIRGIRHARMRRSSGRRALPRRGRWSTLSGCSASSWTACGSSTSSPATASRSCCRTHAPS